MKYWLAFFAVFAVLGVVFYVLMINKGPYQPSAASTADPIVVVNSISQESNERSSREVLSTEGVSLPVAGSVESGENFHSIPLSEIRAGCSRQDCIPSVDSPEFVSIDKADQILVADTVGIALAYKGENRFYPFSMLVTREIVNDVVAGDPLLVTYCPLCGTGIVFERWYDGKIFEFGVSGMLWQSNLLMYNRADDIGEQNLWSQVLGEAVIGKDTGVKLRNVPSDVMQYDVWKKQVDDGVVLNTGRIGDPYDGGYYEVAKRFAPSFNESDSELEPTEYIYGVEFADLFKAYPRTLIPEGESTDTIDGKTVNITRTGSVIEFRDETQNELSDVEGFWFSWKAAHPETLIYTSSL